MKVDISRDFLDGIMLQRQVPKEQQQGDMKVNAAMQFLPSSPDGTMHTGIARLQLLMDGDKEPMAQGGWRFLFTTDEAFEPNADTNNPIMRQILVAGVSKLMAVLNPLCMHANLPLIPIDARQLMQASQQQVTEQQPDA